MNEANKIQTERLKLVETILIFISIPITILGVAIYMGKKKYEYKDNFIFKNFILGTHECRGTGDGEGETIGDFKALQCLFNLQKCRKK